MTGVENQILAFLRRMQGAGAADVARRICVSTEFVQSVMEELEREGRIVKSGSAGYVLSQNEERRAERYKCLEQRRRPFVRW